MPGAGREGRGPAQRPFRSALALHPSLEAYMSANRSVRNAHPSMAHAKATLPRSTLNVASSLSASVSRSSSSPSSASSQGLTLVHFSAQLEPCLSQESTLHTLNIPLTRATQPLRAPRIPYKALKLS